MTWILGSGVVWGYGALIADVRVTFSDSNQSVDGLQKVYPVGNWMLAGFAGSVAFGFHMMDDMKTAFSAVREPTRAWMPEVAAQRWYRRARRAFALAPAATRQLGCSLLLVGVSPLASKGPPETRCIRMCAPDFRPERAGPFSWLSIGTGASHVRAQAYAQMDMEGFANGIGKFEVNNRGGTAATLAGMVARHLRQNPLTTVSDRLLLATAWAGNYEIEMLDARDYEGGWSSWRRVPPEGLARNWPEFEKLVGGPGRAGAACA